MADKAASVATKVEHAVRRGVKAAAEGVETGAKAVGRVADNVARKAGVPGAGQAASAPQR